jgi:hypothetical protein
MRLNAAVNGRKSEKLTTCYIPEKANFLLSYSARFIRNRFSLEIHPGGAFNRSATSPAPEKGLKKP